MRLTGHVARMGLGDLCTGFWWGNVREGAHSEDPGVDGRIKLRWIFRRGVWVYVLDRSGSELEQVTGTYELVNEPSGFTKCGES